MVRMRSLESLKDAGSRGPRDCACWSASEWARPTLPIFRAEGIRKHGGFGPRDRRDLHRRPACRPAGPDPNSARSRATCGCIRTTSTPSIPIGIDQARQAEEAALDCRPAHHQLRRRLLRCLHRRARVRQLARISGILSQQQLLAIGDAGGAGRRVHGARLLVLVRAQSLRARKPRRHRTPRCRADRSTPGRAQSSDPESARGLRARAPPARCSATCSTPWRAMRSIAKRPSSPASWANASHRRTSPSSTTAPCRDSSARLRSTMKASPRAARW